LHKLSNRLNPTLLQSGLQLVLEVFFPEKIETIAGHAAQDRMYDARGKLPIQGIEKGAQHSHQEDQAAAAEALGERLGVPGKECHRPDHGQVKKAALDPPVDGGGRTGVVVC